MNEQTLELQIKSSASDAKSAVDKLVKSLTNVENVVTNMYLELGRIESKSNSTINKTTKDVENLRKTTDKATTSTNKLGSALKGAFTFAGAKRLTMAALGWVNEAIDYTEQLNLFNVVFDNTEKNGKQMFSELGKSALNFQYKLNEAFGTNKTQTLYMQGIFQSMGETVGIDDNYSAIMSETMTKLTYDLASLYNKTESATAEAIRAGVYAGQTKPLRSYGIDVTQMSMQPILDSLGIDEQVKNMSQAEKEILRYLATMKQAQIAMGDLANTIESPSNQLKVFRQQLVEAKVALSSLFIGGLSSILPYANALLMVVKEVSNAIATMFGIELKDYNSGIASQEGIYDCIADSADDASKAVKELKRQTLGFDEIHNINENKDSSSGTSVNGGIDQRLLDAITGYDNGMDKVRMKATEIRDRIMEWLGFTKKIDPLTGKVSFKYGGINKTLKNIWQSFKGLNTQSKILVGIGLYALVNKLFSGTKKLGTVLSGNDGLLGIAKKLLSPMKNLYNSLDNVNYANKTLTQGLSEGITNWSKSLTMADKFKVSLVGILGLSTSMSGMASAMKSVSDEGWNLGNSLQAVASGVGGIASGAYIGSIFGPWGTVIGGATGAVLELVSALNGYQTETDKTISKFQDSSKALNEYLELINDERNAIQESVNANLALTESHNKLITELENLVDENGNVKKGYEERVQYILGTLKSAYGIEYEMVGNQISNYSTLIDKIKKTIQVKQAEILANANEEQYAKDLKNETELWSKKETAIKKYNELQVKYNKLREESLEYYKKNKSFIETAYGRSITFEEYFENKISSNIDGLKDLSKNIEIAKTDMTNATNEYTANITRQTQYSDLQEAIITGNYDKINEAVEKYTNSYIENGEIVQLSLADRLKKEQESSDIISNLYKQKYGEEIPETLKNSAETALNEIINQLVEQTNEVKNGEISNELTDAWFTLGENNKEKFLEKFKELPQDIQQEIVDKMYEKGLNISEELQKGISQINPEIKIKANTTNAENSIDDLITNIKSKLNGGLFGFGGGGGGSRANGGVYSNGSWKNIPQYANGGSPSHGTMFVAGEAGAEIVGHINGKTEVLNRSQIASAIYSAVYSAMSQFSGKSSEIDVHVHTDEGTVIDRIEQRTKQTGVFPFTIPTY